MTHDPLYSASCSWCWIGKITPPKTLVTSQIRETLLATLHTHGHVPLVLLVAPAGYGKTVLLMQWRQELLKCTPNANVAWLSLDEADGEPNRFLAYLILALERSGLKLGHLSRLAESQSLDAQPHRTLRALAHALEQSEQPVTLLLDDYHAVGGHEVNHILQTLIEHTVPWLHVVVASRTRPAWPLSHWRAKGWMHEVPAQQLSLSPDETRRILGPTVAPQDALQLHRTTEGWAVAVQLARVWLASSHGCLFGLTAFSGGVTDIAQYLAEQILASLSTECQSFLLETSLLARFNAELADAVRGRTDSTHLLMQLRHLEALLVPLDAECQWFRYHRLLRDFLSSRVNTHQAQHIHQAAALWLAQANDWVQAVAHALQARDTDLAISLVVRAGGWSLVLSKGIRYAQSLIQQFDEQARQTAPDLLLLQAYLHAKLGNHAFCSQLLSLAEHNLQGDPRLIRDFHLINTLSNTYLDHFEHTVEHRPRLCTDPQEEMLIQATLACVDTMALMINGDINGALKSVRTAQIKMHLVASPRGEIYCNIHESQALALSGDILAARHLMDKALAFVLSHFGTESSLKALIGCLKAQHCYWQGEWSHVPPWLQDGWASLEHTEGWLDIVANTAEVTWRTTLRAKGLQPALHELEHVAEHATARNWQRLHQLVHAWRIEVLVQCGLLTQARKEATQINLEGMAATPKDWRTQHAATLAQARLQIATGAALVALNRLQREGTKLQEKGLQLPRWRLELMALAAACKAQVDINPQAEQQTLAAISPDALPGLLLEVGPWLLPALERNPDALPSMPCVITRLRGWRAHPVRPTILLSPKEAQVLGLLANGLPNKVIAQGLNLSENTIKFHLKNIYAKLAVDNRTAAISAALRQGLLEGVRP
ncbi:LuxR C-terminal-related transcriptional regulator [Pseudomonas sp.]|uniref:LuxR C-terminal-related transcriptional regulator n=1 Tax=Pseudomonas sp. TaxID=306 RepID=UPI00260BEED6|nr:LuxR C-terminal-related transcriptional regulator [Pseudomonas sp.]